MFLYVQGFVVILVRRMTLTLLALNASIKTFLHILNDRHKNSRHLLDKTIDCWINIALIYVKSGQ